MKNNCSTILVKQKMTYCFNKNANLSLFSNACLNNIKELNNFSKMRFSNNPTKGLFKVINKNFSSSNSKSSFYLWLSNVNPGIRTDDYKNRLSMKTIPQKIDFFEGKNPVFSYCGPRHSAVITENGQLYTFGSGNWGVLGHGDEKSVPFNEPKLVEYFDKNNIKIKKVCLGDFHSIALSDTGDVYTWGFGGDKGFLGFFRRDPGALGHGNWKHYFTPKKVSYFSENNIKVKSISCGISHSVVLSEDGKVYTFGRGTFGLLGLGNNKDQPTPNKVELLDLLQKENSDNEITKIDCADEYTGALTKGGDLYVWGKNNQGQLGIGSGIGVDMTESESFPTQVYKIPKNLNIVDFDCGENGMMIKSKDNIIYKTGWRIDYNMSEYKITRKIQTKLFFCGNSYYCIIDKDNKIYQWGSLFKNSYAVPDEDMLRVDKKVLFDNKNIIMISGKFRVCGAIVSE